MIPVNDPPRFYLPKVTIVDKDDDNSSVDERNKNYSAVIKGLKVYDVDADIRNENVTVRFSILPKGAVGATAVLQFPFDDDNLVIVPRRSHSNYELMGIYDTINDIIRTVIYRDCRGRTTTIASTTVRIIAVDHHGATSTAGYVNVTLDNDAGRARRRPPSIPSLRSIDDNTTFVTEEDRAVSLSSIVIIDDDNNTIAPPDDTSYKMTWTSRTVSTLEIQSIRITPPPDIPRPVQDIILRGDSDNGMFCLCVTLSHHSNTSCTSSDISFRSASRTVEETMNGSERRGTGESVESRINNVECLRERNVVAEVVDGNVTLVEGGGMGYRTRRRVWRVTFPLSVFVVIP